MAERRWSDLDPGAQKAIVLTAGVDAALRIAALIDLARRPATQVRGSRRRWAVAIAVVNSAGLLPIAYFLRGRRSPQPTMNGVVR